MSGELSLLDYVLRLKNSNVQTENFIFYKLIILHNNLTLIASFLPHITHKVMKNWKFFTNILNQVLRNCVKMIQMTGTNASTKY